MQCKLLVHSGSNIVVLKFQIRMNALGTSEPQQDKKDDYMSYTLLKDVVQGSLYACNTKRDSSGMSKQLRTQYLAAKDLHGSYMRYKAALLEPSRVNFPLRSFPVVVYKRLRKRQRARSAIRLRLVNTTTDPAEAMGNFLFDDDIKFRIETEKTQSRVVDLIVSTLRLSNFDIVASYVLGPDACC
nr:hypothetical protein [Tanacetum cinerariifolium]